MKHPEFDLQKAICRYLDAQWPKILYMSDTVASLKLAKTQATRNKAIQKQGFKTPDLIIFHPNKYFHALFLELKVKSPYQRNGKLYANEHLEGQEATLNDLAKLGYFAQFAWSFDMAKAIIDNYLKDANLSLPITNGYV